MLNVLCTCCKHEINKKVVRGFQTDADVLRAHGSSQQSLKNVFRATVESKLQYAAPAWSGYCTAGDRDRLNAFLRRCVKLGYRDKSAPFMEDIFSDCDDQLFASINTNGLHILQ